jgi:CrcB protein
MFRMAIIVGVGGFIGTVVRYFTSNLIHKLFPTNFPLGTLVVNLAGCLLIGVIIGLFEKGSILSLELRLFLTVGFCGGFTTFSAFLNDTINLASESEMLSLAFYTGISIFAGIACTFLGKGIVNYFFTEFL